MTSWPALSSCVTFTVSSHFISDLTQLLFLICNFPQPPASFNVDLQPVQQPYEDGGNCPFHSHNAPMLFSRLSPKCLDLVPFTGHPLLGRPRVASIRWRNRRHRQQNLLHPELRCQRHKLLARTLWVPQQQLYVLCRFKKHPIPYSQVRDPNPLPFVFYSPKEKQSPSRGIALTNSYQRQPRPVSAPQHRSSRNLARSIQPNVSAHA